MDYVFVWSWLCRQNWTRRLFCFWSVYWSFSSALLSGSVCTQKVHQHVLTWPFYAFTLFFLQVKMKVLQTSRVWAAHAGTWEHLWGSACLCQTVVLSLRLYFWPTGSSRVSCDQLPHQPGRCFCRTREHMNVFLRQINCFRKKTQKILNYWYLPSGKSLESSAAHEGQVKSLLLFLK